MAEFTQTYTVNCPDCDSEDVVKNGSRNDYQRYMCQDCSKHFRVTGQPQGRQYPAEVIGAALDMYYSGMSYKQIAEHIEMAHNLPEPSKSTIFEWVQDYTTEAQAEMGQPANTPDVGDHWVADEMAVKVGGEQYWHWNVLDRDTRYLLASHLSKSRGKAEAIKVMEQAVQEAGGKLPKAVTTDKLGSYTEAIATVMPNTKHVQSQGLQAEINNNMSERLQGTARQRTKTLRGLENRQSGQRYLDGFVLDYNLFRKHEALGGGTPATKAGIQQPYSEWADVARDRVQQAIGGTAPTPDRSGSATKAANYVSNPKKPRHSKKRRNQSQAQGFQDGRLLGPKRGKRVK